MKSHVKRPKGSVIASIDIGSAKTACFIAHVIDDNGGAEVIGIGHVASKGVKSGVIVDVKEAQASVKQAVHAAETMAAKIMKGYPLRDVVMGVPSNYTSSSRLSVTVNMMGHVIEGKDIESALVQLEAQDHDDAHVMIHSIPISYKVDGHGGVEDPVGMHAETFRVDMHCVKAETAPLRNVLGCAGHSHLDVDCLCIAPYAAGLSVLVEDEKNMGCLVIDMGAGVTSYAVFYQGTMIHAGAIPVGGWHVTNDLAMGLHTSFQAAERVKTLYGSCATALADSNELIDIPPLTDEDFGEDRQVPRSDIVNIIRPRMEEIFELIRGDIDVNQMDGYAGGRVVLTGGACQLPGARDLAGLMLNKQVRIGRPLSISGLAEMTKAPEFAATAGLIHYACERMNEQPHGEDRRNDEPFWPRLKKWLKENW